MPAEADRSAFILINSEERLGVSETMQTSHDKDSTRHYQTEIRRAEFYPTEATARALDRPIPATKIEWILIFCGNLSSGATWLDFSSAQFHRSNATRSSRGREQSSVGGCKNMQYIFMLDHYTVIVNTTEQMFSIVHNPGKCTEVKIRRVS
jgi:hypothetical protein